MTKADLEKVFQTARQLLNRSWAVEAEQLVRTAIAMHPGTPELQDLLGECLLRQGRWMDSLAVLMDGVRAFPEDQGLKLRLGQFLAGEGLHTAMEVFRQVEESHGSDPLVLLEIAMTLADLGDPAEAERYATRALEVDEDYYDAWIELAHIRIDAGDWRGAVQPIRRAIDLGGARADLWVDLAAAYLHLGFYGEAEKALDEAEQMDEEHVGLSYYRAALSASQRDQQRALRHLRRAFSTQPERLRRLFQVDRFFDEVRELPEVLEIIGTEAMAGEVKVLNPRRRPKR
ncbi:MAG: hypothetical protein CMH55_05790 [Myxococcales bacterium]|nr:hypothetical protein [Myxococcales bacterium]